MVERSVQIPAAIARPPENFEVGRCRGGGSRSSSVMSYILLNISLRGYSRLPNAELIFGLFRALKRVIRYRMF